MTSKKRKQIERESSPEPRWFVSQSSQVMKLAARFKKLKYDTVNLPKSAFLFKVRDIKKLNVTFEEAKAETEVIPNIQADMKNLQKYIAPNFNYETISSEAFNIAKITDITDGRVLTFLSKLNSMILNCRKTISFVYSLLFAADLDNYPSMISIRPMNKLVINGQEVVTAQPGFVVTSKKLMFVIEEDDGLKNISISTGYGESQIGAEILACAYTNRSQELVDEDQTIFAMRIISAHATFYKAIIPAGYWKDLDEGFPKEKIVRVTRWPARNGKMSGYNLGNPKDRQNVLRIMAKIRELLLL
ncbi:hypothetical protein GLOIN_2v1766170 [Rhizophagus clarus]|uniref:Uncharacterized protein n=1 Tax=Rhizophagus clarus TaxID=94130 RepID=A0A8H3L653_9GLOM|nr:hypothetical protein GLOIN_2v1766170 [Rhizophagus clarus]